MQYKYKLSEMSKTAPPEEAAKELKRKPGEDFEVGQVTYSDDGLRKSVVTNINPETGAVRWDIIQLPGFETLYDELDDLVDISKRVYVKTKDDKKFREFYEEARKLRNKVRTHLRNEYPDEYKNITRIAEDVESSETNLTNAVKLKYNNAIGSSSDFADAILDIWNELSAKENDAITQTNALKQAKALLAKQSSQEDVDEISTSSGAGAYLTPYAFRLKGKKPNIKAYKELGYEEVNENKKNPGATLGPGPAASEDGVKDNYYVKAFKFKLVPKKIKDSGIIVKQLF
jgi:hypothetical protein|tara:strand:- start:1448 stop:2308 length:861 start_codon:yes stop_codon:yes gene_type:complete